MKRKEILRKTLLRYVQSDLPTEELKEMKKEDIELYLFLRGGFSAK